MIANEHYSKMIGYFPINVINAYHRHKNYRRPDAWLDFELFYIHVPKSAGTSICDVLQMPDSGHLLFDEMHPKTADALSRKRCFIVVRDPLQRLVSTYNYAKDAVANGRRNLVNTFGTYGEISDFLDHFVASEGLQKHYFLRPAALFYKSAVARGAFVDVLRFEDINTALPEYLSSFGLPKMKLPRKRVSQRASDGNTSQISPEVSSRIYELYSEDEVLRSGCIPG